MRMRFVHFREESTILDEGYQKGALFMVGAPKPVHSLGQRPASLWFLMAIHLIP